MLAILVCVAVDTVVVEENAFDVFACIDVVDICVAAAVDSESVVDNRSSVVDDIKEDDKSTGFVSVTPWPTVLSSIVNGVIAENPATTTTHF